MSAVPSYKLQCGPLVPRKYPPGVVGTSNISMGYRLRSRSSCRIANLPVSYEHYEAEKRREYEALMKTMDFEEQTDSRIRAKKLWKRVQQGMAAYEETVNQRRQRLREVLLREETNLIHEVVDQAQHGDDARMDEVRQRTEEIRKQQEDQRLAFVAAKKTQQYLAQCPEVRSKLIKKFTVEAKQSNLAQIADNEAKRQAEKELDHMWHSLMLKEVDTKKQREEEEARARCLLGQDTMTTLAKQVAGKLALEEEKRRILEEDKDCMARMKEELRQEELERLEKERKKRERLRSEIQEQIMATKRQLAEKARQDAEIDRLRQSITDEEIEQERRKLKETSSELRRELLTYLQYLEDLKNEEAKRHGELDRILAQSLKDAAAKRDAATKMFKEARERSLKEVLQGREEQLRIKCELEKVELEKRRMEQEAVEKEIEIEARLAARAKEEERCKMLRYKKDLEEQVRLSDEARRRDAEADRRRYIEELKRQEESEKLTEELLKASENITPHPFKIILKEYAARYTAEREDRCYCPPLEAED